MVVLVHVPADVRSSLLGPGVARTGGRDLRVAEAKDYNLSRVKIFVFGDCHSLDTDPYA